MKRITGPLTSLSGPFQLDNPNTFWWVNGVGYTDDPGLIGYCQRNPAYVVTDGSPDEAYTAAVASLKGEAQESSLHTNVAQDAATGARPNYVSVQS